MKEKHREAVWSRSLLWSARDDSGSNLVLLERGLETEEVDTWVRRGVQRSEN